MHTRMLSYFLLQLCLILSISADHPDRVVNLPDAPDEPSFPLYAGFLNVEIEDGQHKIFYVLCEAISANPLDAPLVVWLNGGPGASSLIGFLLEHGPYILEQDTGKLRYNDFSWNQYANVLYIESPSNVGFSRSNQSISSYNDNATAELNMRALEDFMTRVHPRYSSRDFFITGESYAGVYIPFLTQAVLTGIQNGTFTNDRFKGIAMGNPGMDMYTRWLSAGMQMFAMGSFQKQGPQLMQYWMDLQRGPEGVRDMDDFNYFVTTMFREFDSDLKAVNVSSKEFIYNAQLSCENSDSEETWDVSRPLKGVECDIKDGIGRYFNRPDVQKALHVINDENNTVNWVAINRSVFQAYPQHFDTIPLYSKIFEDANENFRVLFYSGDLDLACPAIHVARGTELIAMRNRFQVFRQAPIIWQYLGDFGGAMTNYQKIKSNITMDVLTVRGAGHLVPINHPSRAFQIINNFLFSTERPIDYSQKIRRRQFH